MILKLSQLKLKASDLTWFTFLTQVGKFFHLKQIRSLI